MDAKKRFGWEAAARRTLQSEKIELESIPGHWFKAKKYSVAAQDELQAEAMRRRDRIPAELRALVARAEAEGRTPESIIAELPPAESERLAAAIPADAASSADMITLSLKHGIGENNLGDDENAFGLSADLLSRIMEYPDLAAELFRGVTEWNRPLVQARSETSGTP